MSICRACSKYRDVSRALGDAIRSHAGSTDDSVDVERLNEGLLKKYSKDS